MQFRAKYKTARRLGAHIYEKTQTQKFAAKASDKAFTKKRAGSDFGLQLLEKQKARFTYGLNERQFKNMVSALTEKKTSNLNEALMQELETRLDNTIYRLGFAKTRQAARQMVSHGHINLNGKRLTVPSLKVKVGDTVSIRENSQGKTLFKDLDERLKEQKVPSWLALDAAKRTAKVQGLPKIPENEINFDISAIFQFYSR
jgi:small subunit ribosomal protein S4